RGEISMTDARDKLDRRSFMSGALGTAAGVGAALMTGAMQAQAQEAPAERLPGVPPDDELRPSMRRPTALYRLEADVRDCEVEGEIPSDLNGAFYRVGPDPQYPLRPGNIPFDGEGHVSMFRIKNGRVDYRSR